MYKIVNQKKLLATVLADLLGTIFFLPRTLLRRPKPLLPEEVKSICVIRTAYIGDVVMTLPLLPLLKERFPAATLTVLTSEGAAPLLRGNPHVDRVLTFDPFWFYSKATLRQWWDFIRRLRHYAFDLVIEARGDIREIGGIMAWMRTLYKVGYTVGGGGYLLTHPVPYPGPCHKVDYHCHIARHLGSTAPIRPESICLTPEERERATRLLAAHGVGGGFIALHPGSRLPLKRWYPERFAALCDLLHQSSPLPIVLLGGPGEQELLAQIQGLMQTPPIVLAEPQELRQLAAILAQARLFICNDSAPMHIAAAMRTPTVAIFGPSKPAETAPYATLSEVVAVELPCRASCDEGRCRYNQHHACMNEITVEKVFAAVKQIANKSR